MPGRTGAGDQVLHGGVDFLHLAVADRDDLECVIFLRLDVDALEQLEHALDVGGVVAQDERLADVERHDAGGVLGHRREHRHSLAGQDMFQLRDVRDVLVGLRQIIGAANDRERGALLQRVGAGDEGDEFFPDWDGGVAVEREDAVHRLDGLDDGQRCLRLESDVEIGQRRRPQDGPVDVVGVNLKELLQRHVDQLQVGHRDDGVQGQGRTGGISRGGRRCVAGCRRGWGVHRLRLAKRCECQCEDTGDEVFHGSRMVCVKVHGSIVSCGQDGWGWIAWAPCAWPARDWPRPVLARAWSRRLAWLRMAWPQPVLTWSRWPWVALP